MNKITTCLLQRFTSFSYIFDRAEEEENFTFYTCRVTIKAEHSNSFHNVSSRTFFLYTAQGTLFCTITSERIFALRLKFNELSSMSVCFS